MDHLPAPPAVTGGGGDALPAADHAGPGREARGPQASTMRSRISTSRAGCAGCPTDSLRSVAAARRFDVGIGGLSQSSLYLVREPDPALRRDRQGVHTIQSLSGCASGAPGWMNVTPCPSRERERERERERQEERHRGEEMDRRAQVMHKAGQRELRRAPAPRSCRWPGAPNGDAFLLETDSGGGEVGPRTRSRRRR